MNVEQVISDTVALIQALRVRFDQEKIYLVGHSWGIYPGMLVVDRHPELFHAYVGIGQLTGKGHNSQDIAEIQDDFIRKKAEETHNTETLKELDSADGIDREKWIFRFGGELHHATSMRPLIITGLQAPEYNLRAIYNIIQGANFTHKHMQYNALQGALIDMVTSLQIPIYFFTGRYDYTDPFTLTQQYFEKIHAPIKKMVWFEDSAHFPFFEEPGSFSKEMVKVLSETRES